MPADAASPRESRLYRNAAFSFVQAVVTLLVYVVMYWYIVRRLGLERLGVWSLVLGATSVAGMANLGLSGSVVRFVARYQARGDPRSAASAVQTAFLSLSLLFAVLALLVQLLGPWLLSQVLPSSAVAEALDVLPFSLVSLVVGAAATAFQSGLDGCERIHVRASLVVLSMLFQLGVVFVAVPLAGLRGVAVAQVAQAVFLLVGALALLRRYLPGVPILRHRWSARAFREMVGYGLRLQVISIVQLLYEPVTKFLLVGAGGLALAGVFEMANRMLLQTRTLLLNTTSALVPTIAQLEQTSAERVDPLYRSAYDAVAFLVLVLFPAVACCSPIIGRAWMGRWDPAFPAFAAMLACGWSVNALTLPAYFANLGLGTLRWNVVGHVAVGLGNAGLGFALGRVFGGYGVAAGWAAALALGSACIPIGFHLSRGIPLRSLVPASGRVLLPIAVAGLIVATAMSGGAAAGLVDPRLAALVGLGWCIVIGLGGWFHPLRSKVVDEFLRVLGRRSPEPVPPAEA